MTIVLQENRLCLPLLGGVGECKDIVRAIARKLDITTMHDFLTAGQLIL